MDSSIIYSALQSGGAILLQSNSVLRLGVVVENNSALQNGGGIAAFDSSLISLTDGAIIKYNTAGHHGGGMYSDGSQTIFGKFMSPDLHVFYFLCIRCIKENLACNFRLHGWQMGWSGLSRAFPVPAEAEYILSIF